MTTKPVEELAIGHDRAQIDIARIRADFPILALKVHNHRLAFLDNAASTQKPEQVIEAIGHYYRAENANIHRAVYYLSELATRRYEEARETVRTFINAASLKEVIFTSGTTDGINLVAQAYGGTHIKAGDEIVISTMEHHSNIVPWQLLCERTGAKLRVIPINDRGEIILDEYRKVLNERTRIVAIVHVSNSLGTINPVKQMIDLAHAGNIPVLIDGAQAIPHLRIDVQALECDFFAFSGHKIFGPTGIGVLYAREALLNTMQPYRGGGDMIRSVTFEATTYNDLPFKFEAGTPNMAGAIGLAAALDYVSAIGYDAIGAHEKELLSHATERLSAIPQLRIIGTAAEKTGVVSFVIDGIHPHDIGTFLDRDGIAIRTGHHCTQPVMDRFQIPATSRASFAIYNMSEEIDRLAESLENIIEVFN